MPANVILNAENEIAISLPLICTPGGKVRFLFTCVCIRFVYQAVHGVCCSSQWGNKD